jgi:hypothetical protein
LSIHHALQRGTNITLETTATRTHGTGTAVPGPGDIDIESGIAWTTSATLTLEAYNSIDVSSLLDVKGTGTLSMTYNTGGGSGVLEFTNGGRAEFTDISDSLALGSLEIDGHNYTVASTLPELATLMNGDLSGYYALANNYNARSEGTVGVPVPGDSANPFTGDFEGLGNLISNLHINVALFDGGVYGGGLFAFLDGSVENLNLESDNIVLTTYDSPSAVGILAGTADGASLFNVTTSGNVRAHFFGYAGGLVGFAEDTTISVSSSSASVTSDTGSRLHTTTGATFAVEDGGLVGRQYMGFITDSFATGDVTMQTLYYGSVAGGLVGNAGGGIRESFATGDVDVVDNIHEVAGGLVGQGGAISNSYATGSVTGGAGSTLGGFIGLAFGDGASALITDDYSTGLVSGGASGAVGGFAGADDSSNNLYANCYWDLSSSGISNPSQGVGSVSNNPGITGLTTAQFQSGLPTGFDSSIWGQSDSINGGLPYLLSLPPITSG